MSARPLTDQMRAYLAALYWCGNVKGFRFGVGFDSTRKALMKRGLVVRVVEFRGPDRRTERVRFILTDAGVEQAKALADPRDSARPDVPMQRRLSELREGPRQ